jgi:hypothetical protein
VASGIKGIQGARREKQPKLVGFVYLQFFLSNSFGKFLSGVWQHISCSFYRFRDTREKVENIDFRKPQELGQIWLNKKCKQEISQETKENKLSKLDLK